MDRSTTLRATVGGLGLALAGLTVAATATAGGRPLSTDLSGANEVPGPGDPEGSGTAEITVNLGRNEICYELAVANIAPATMAHIHFAPAGSPGPVVVSGPMGSELVSRGVRWRGHGMLTDADAIRSLWIVSQH